MVIAYLKILGNDDAVATQEFVVPQVPPKRKRPHKKSPVKPPADKSGKVQVQTEHFVTVFFLKLTVVFTSPWNLRSFAFLYLFFAYEIYSIIM